MPRLISLVLLTALATLSWSGHADARHRLTTLTTPATVDGSAITRWTHDPDGNVATATTPNGKVLTSTFDALNRQTTASVDNPDLAEIAMTTWHHDGNGNVTAIDESIDGSVRHATRHYDAFDRLDADTDVYGKALTTYAYDEADRLADIATPDRITHYQLATRQPHQ